MKSNESFNDVVKLYCKRGSFRVRVIFPFFAIWPSLRNFPCEKIKPVRLDSGNRWNFVKITPTWKVLPTFSRNFPPAKITTYTVNFINLKCRHIEYIHIHIPRDTVKHILRDLIFRELMTKDVFTRLYLCNYPFILLNPYMRNMIIFSHLYDLANLRKN